MREQLKQYSLAQWEKPYYGTIEFQKVLKRAGCLRPGTKVMDIGTGMGYVLEHFREENPDIEFWGVDYSAEEIALGQEIVAERGLQGITLEVGDWFDLNPKYIDMFDGIFNIHTLCCFKHFEPAIDALVPLNPRWIAFKSVFWDGPLDILIHIRNHEMPEITDDDPNSDFNTFSLPRSIDYLKQVGFNKVIAEPFHMPVDLPRPANGARGTFTMQTEEHPRSQFSGPIHLHWYFLIGIKDE